MALGFGLLRLSPSAFWAMSPRELAAALAPLGPAEPGIGRERLGALMQEFPDTEVDLG
ncbi:MAG: phage tail assembly chaperone [Mesorhizobium amorphae]|nr:MAG: phage tail assembly chaperone [Mesorhizobium amorphae]